MGVCVSVKAAHCLVLVIKTEREVCFVQFYFQFRLTFYVRKIFNQLIVVESLMAGSLRNCACHYITTKTNYQTENPDLFLISALYFSYNSQSDCQLDPSDLLVTLEQHGFELQGSTYTRDSFH